MWVRIILSVGLHLIGPGTVAAQALVDTLFTWQGYGQTGTCRIRLYAAPADEEDERKYAIILQEMSENRGPSTAADIRHLVELAGRAFGIDPAGAYWVLHWGAFSFEGAQPDRQRELFLRATFRRTKSGTLGSPSWRLLTREEVEDLTDRQFR